MKAFIQKIASEIERAVALFGVTFAGASLVVPVKDHVHQVVVAAVPAAAHVLLQMLPASLRASVAKFLNPLLPAAEKDLATVVGKVLPSTPAPDPTPAPTVPPVQIQVTSPNAIPPAPNAG